MDTRHVSALLIAIAFAGNAYGADPWGYRGIYLGARMTEDQVMHALNADRYVKNPTYDAFDNSHGCDKNPAQKICKQADFYKYGIQSFEVEQERVGAACEEQKPNNFSCVNPTMGGSIPNWLNHGHGVVSVQVFVDSGVVSTIDIKFDSLNDDDFFDVVRRQLGPTGWKVEHQQPFHISDIQDHNKNAVDVDRETDTKQTKLYSAMMTNYDQIWTHRAGPLYQGILEFKLLDQTL